jgi:hypothetical protein
VWETQIGIGVLLISGSTMKKLLEKQSILDYRGPQKRDPLEYWISPRTLFHLLWVLGAAGVTMALLLPRYVNGLAAIAGYVCVLLAIFVWHVELRK